MKNEGQEKKHYILELTNLIHNLKNPMLHYVSAMVSLGFPGVASGKEPIHQSMRHRDLGSIPGSGRYPGGRFPSPVFLPGESYGQRSLAGYSPYGCKGADTTEAT